ncbi:MAG: hypothetical protein Q4P32_05710 [Micrococcales bacterium]|nr:hypothetical protein [Micrococcales bacterium]
MASDGLSIGYRIWWSFRKFIMSVFGPAQLSGESDPVEKLRHERAAKVAQIQRERGTS